MFKNKFVRFILLFSQILLFVGCDMQTNVVVPCDPLPVVDGYREIKLEDSNVTLRLPEYADLRREPSEEEGEGCEYARNIFVTYLWYEGKLIPEGSNRFKVPDGEQVKVSLIFGLSGDKEFVEKSMQRDPRSNNNWRYDSPLAHKRFPLEYYPKYYWDDPVNPSNDSLKRARRDSIWGVIKTRYKNALTDRYFFAICPIPPSDKADPNSRIESDLANYPASTCQVGMLIATNDKYISVSMRVWAYLGGNNQKGILELNHISDAMVEEVRSFIKE